MDEESDPPTNYRLYVDNRIKEVDKRVAGVAKEAGERVVAAVGTCQASCEQTRLSDRDASKVRDGDLRGLIGNLTVAIQGLNDTLTQGPEAIATRLAVQEVLLKRQEEWLTQVNGRMWAFGLAAIGALATAIFQYIKNGS